MSNPTFQKPRLPNDEPERLDELRRYSILDTLPEAAFDDLTFLASFICQTPISLVSLIDADRQWFKSRVGLPQTPETSRDISFCAYAILESELFIVPDTLRDDRFTTNPMVAGEPYIRFYAGVPLIVAKGFALGTLGVLDRVPRQLTVDQKRALLALGRQALIHLERRRLIAELAEVAGSVNDVGEKICSLVAAAGKWS